MLCKVPHVSADGLVIVLEKSSVQWRSNTNIRHSRVHPPLLYSVYVGIKWPRDILFFYNKENIDISYFPHLIMLNCNTHPLKKTSCSKTCSVQTDRYYVKCECIAFIINICFLLKCIFTTYCTLFECVTLRRRRFFIFHLNTPSFQTIFF